jgi:hypothetical protein
VGQFSGQLDRLLRVAEERGPQAVLLDILREVRDEVQRHPREWGDPYTNLRALNVVRYGRPLLPSAIRVEYAVHNEKPFVWLSAIWALPGSPFA